MLFVMYILKLFKRDVLVSGRYKRSFECLDNGVVYLIDYKNDMVDGSYKIYGSYLATNKGKLIRCNDFDKDVTQYVKFYKNIMKLDYYHQNLNYQCLYYYINRTIVYSFHNVHSFNKVYNNVINKDNPKFINYKDVIYKSLY